MSEESINIDDKKKIKKIDFYENKKVLQIDDFDINKILVSEKEPYGKKYAFKYFIGIMIMMLLDHYLQGSHK